jgi:anti-anti-sigma factor
MRNLKITTTSLTNGFRMALEGEAGMEALEELEGEMARIVAEAPELVAIDLSALTFISSAGMGAFLMMRMALVKKNGALRVGGATPEIAEAFRRARLDRVLEFVDSVWSHCFFLANLILPNYSLTNQSR